MNLYKNQYLGIEPEFTQFESSAVCILPFPYEGGVSYGKGTGEAPDAIIQASAYLELYDEIFDAEMYRIGVSTIQPPVLSVNHKAMFQQIYNASKELLDLDKFVVVIGGDHSISSGYFKALKEKYGSLSCIQLDAHSDLRDSYEGSKLSHASVMSRIREMTSNTLQIGIRSMCVEEAELIKADQIPVCTMHQFRKGLFDLDRALQQLPDPVFITLDVDVFDWSVVTSTGTPEPGGLLWDEAIDLLEKIFSRKNVVGFDVVELSAREGDDNSPFAIAKLIYKMIGFKLLASYPHDKIKSIRTPHGPLFKKSAK